MSASQEQQRTENPTTNTLTFTKKSFKIDLSCLGNNSNQPGQTVSNLFSSLDQHLLQKFPERKDLLRCYKDIPLPLSNLYTQPNYIIDRHA